MNPDTLMSVYAWLSLSALGLVILGGGVAIINSHVQTWKSGRQVQKLQDRRDELFNLLLNEQNGHPHHQIRG